jgi:hypothetical protein
MSIILDALKKLELKKQRGSAPDLMAVHASEFNTPQNKKLWPLLITIILVINAVVFGAFFYTSDKNEINVTPTADKITSIDTVADIKSSNDDATVLPPSSAEDHPNTLKPETVSLKENILEKPMKGEKHIQQEQISNDQESPEPLTSVSGTREFLPTEDELLVLRDKIKEEQSTIPDPPAMADDLPAQDNSDNKEPLPEFSQLSKDMQKELPSISINGHIYSDNPSSRMVNINGHIMREGEEIADDLRIDEITLSGIIFTYKDIRFRIRVF